MKVNIILIIICVLCNTAYSQGLIGYDKAKRIKEGKLIVQSDWNEKRNEALKKAVDTHWTYSEVMGMMSPDEAIEAAKANDAIYIMRIRKVSSVAASSSTASGTRTTTRDASSGYLIELHRGKLVPAIYAFMPLWTDSMADVITCFAVSSLQGQLEAAYNNKLKTHRLLSSAIRTNAELLKERTLYIPIEWIAPSPESQKGLLSLYSGKAELVPLKTWRNAIVSREKGVAYTMVVEVAAAGSYTYSHYLMDAETGAILGVINPKVAYAFGFDQWNHPSVNPTVISKYDEIYKGKKD